ncbi:slightly ste11-like protein [Clarireedia jacksonii]
MSFVGEAGRESIDTSRDASISTESSLRNSLRPVLPEQKLDTQASVSPRHSTRLSKKRAESIDAQSANQAQLRDLSLNTATTTGPSPTSDASREQVCLCQPDPKIPRPRNAFILYRQHYQAQVVAQNPGLANPEISKIIGGQWREQDPESKEEWKKLAEEEKQRHQRQYPGYRYQPKRAGKSNGARPSSSSNSEDPARCPKCNGRYISTPSTPLTPFTPAFGAPAPRNDQPLQSYNPNQPQTNELEKTRYMSQMSGISRIESPRAAPPPQMQSRRYPYPQTILTHHGYDQDIDMVSLSPDLKRRRFANDPRAYPQPSPMQYSSPQQASFNRNMQVPMSVGSFRRSPQTPQFQQSNTNMSRAGSMGPPQTAPLRSHRHQSHTPVYPNHTPTSANQFDESLRLPPLQTQLPATSQSSYRPPVDHRQEAREAQAKSIEAMVMTIPFVTKLGILAMISPPLAAPGPSSPAQDIRGGIIAVEGTDIGLIKEVGDFLNEELSKDPQCFLRTWKTDPISSAAVGSTVDVNTEMQGIEMAKTLRKEYEKVEEKGKDTRKTHDRLSAVQAQEERDPFIDYLTTITQWHEKSHEMIRYITAIPPSVPAVTYSTSTTTSTSKSPILPDKTIPIALLPRGYSLTLSDAHSLQVPINDSYAPFDHWQWMATLWRGIVGADLTVYCKEAGKEEYERFGGVELMQNIGGEKSAGRKGIVVRVMSEERDRGLIGERGERGEREAGVSAGASDGLRRMKLVEGGNGGEKGNGKWKMDEKTRRRLAFEVGEWVRGIDGRWEQN